MSAAREWLAVLIALAAFIWTVVESNRTRRALRDQEERQEAGARRMEITELLNSFLLRLQSVFARSRRDFEFLMSGQAEQIRRLEYYPAALRKHFESLPEDRRLFWERDLQQLHLHNADAIRLIDDFGSSPHLTPEFQEACEAFRTHATRWKSRWDAIVDSTIETSNLPSGQMADPFPVGLDELLNQEVARLKARAET